MGLDMYLTGRKYLWQSWRDPKADRQEDGFRIEEIRLALGYWRKHPNLHGFIVKTFAEGKDECQDIELMPDDIRTIIDAINGNALPETSGFFFGKSECTDEERRDDIAIFENALAWVQKQPAQIATEPVSITEVAGMVLKEYRTDVALPRESRDVIYRASW
jgi:hypothetical protein